MKRILIIVGLLLTFVPLAKADNGTVFITGTRGDLFQVFVPDPAKSQVNSAMTGTVVFKKGTGGTVDCTGWIMLRVDPTANATYHFNSDTTKTFPIYAGKENIIPLRQLPIGGSVTLTLSTATASVQGM